MPQQLHHPCDSEQFGFQTTARRNPVYIQYIPRTLRYVRDNLENLPEFARIRELLAAHVEEFR